MTTKCTIEGENDEIEEHGLGPVLRPHRGHRSLKILQRRCIRRVPDPTKKYICLENMEQATNTFIPIHAWKIETMLIIYKEALTRT